MRRREFIQKLVVGVITATFLKRFLSASQAGAVAEIEQERIRRELEGRYGKKEAEIASRIIMKYIKMEERGIITKEEAAKFCFEELINNPETPKIAAELRRILKKIEEFKHRKREYYIHVRG